MNPVEAMRLARELLDAVRELTAEVRELRAQQGGWDSYAAMIRELRELRGDRA